MRAREREGEGEKERERRGREGGRREGERDRERGGREEGTGRAFLSCMCVYIQAVYVCIYRESGRAGVGEWNQSIYAVRESLKPHALVAEYIYILTCDIMHMIYIYMIYIYILYIREINGSRAYTKRLNIYSERGMSSRRAYIYI